MKDCASNPPKSVQRAGSKDLPSRWREAKWCRPAETAGQIAVARKPDPRCKEAVLADAELATKLGRRSEAEKLFRELI